VLRVGIFVVILLLVLLLSMVIVRVVSHRFNG